MPLGYNGRILRVDLTREECRVEEPTENWYRTYWGGSGIAAYYLLKLLSPGVDPLSPANVLVFTASVVTGAPISGFNRYTVAAKSPLSGTFSESEAGGYFGPEMKFAGFDAVVVEGRAPRPVYLHLAEGRGELRDAAALWGLDNWQTLQAIQEDLGDKRVRVASIGPAGERLCRFACVQNDLEHYNGRGGLGAVMGAKNLKAVAARGKRAYDFADPEKVKDIARWHNARIKEHPANVGLSAAGTPALVKGLNAGGILPTRNFREGTFEGADQINWDAYKESIFAGPGTCWRCTVACKRKVKLDDEHYPLNPNWGGPEYEALAALGSLVGNANLKALARGNQLCNLLGMDVISAGGLVAFAMECCEAGILTEADLDGRLVKFGDADGMLWLLDKIARREGIGDVLAEGVRRAAERIGRGAERFAFHIKGQELAIHDGRGKTGVALGFALSPTGADHIECPHDPGFVGEGFRKLAPMGLLEPVDPLALDEAKVRFFLHGQRAWGINNLLSICNFTSVPVHAMTFGRLVEAVAAITGWETSLLEIARGVERANVMMRCFNLREGFGPDDDRLIRRWHEPMPDGPLKGRKIEEAELRKAIQLYYAM